MRNQRVLFGQTHFGPAHLYRLRSDQGLEVEISDWGLALRQVLTPVEQGPSQPWLLGMRSIADYIQPHPWLGTVVGRVANRIRGASFHDGRRRWTLPANERTHLLHGAFRAAGG